MLCQSFKTFSLMNLTRQASWSFCEGPACQRSEEARNIFLGGYNADAGFIGEVNTRFSINQ